MHNNNFIKAFQHLSPLQKKRFFEFIQSPYFNRQNELVKLLSYITKISQKNRLLFERKQLWKAVFPSSIYHLPQLRYYLSDLMKLLRRFLLIDTQQNEYSMHFHIAKAVRKFEDNNWYQKEWTSTEKKLTALTHRNAQYFLHSYHHQLEAQDFLSSQSRVGYTLLPKAQNDLLHFFIAEQLKLACLSDQTINDESKLNLLPTIIQSVQSAPEQFPVVVQVYFQAYLITKVENSDHHFQQLSHLLEHHNSLFPKNELEDLYLMAINYCIRQLNQSKQTFVQKAFDLYEQGISNGALLAQGHLSVFNYKNVIRLGLALKQNDWVETFMEKYKNQLPPNDRENTYIYNLAFYYYNKPDYDKAMELLRNVKLKDVLNNMDARWMLTRIYYARKEWMALDSWLESFKAYVIRQKGIGYHKKAYLNFIRTVKALMKADTAEKKNKISKRLLTYDRVADREWLEDISKP